MLADVGFAPVDSQAALVEVAEHLVDESTLLLAATGSLSNGSWKAGWSDIDVLFVRRELPPRWMERRIGALTIEPAAHVSAFSEAEIEAGLLPPRVINALRLIAKDGRGVIVRAPAWVQPDFGLEVGARASLLDLPQALLLLRRHALTGVQDLRAAYKLIILVSRIVLRQQGVEPDTGDDVISAMAAHHMMSPDWIPRVDEVANGHDHSGSLRRVEAGVHAVLGLADGQLTGQSGDPS